MKKYSYHRIKKIMNEDYNFALIKTNGGYKGFRYRVQTYYLTNLGNNKIFLKDITLDALRLFLTSHDYPLKVDE